MPFRVWLVVGVVRWWIRSSIRDIAVVSSYRVCRSIRDVHSGSGFFFQQRRPWPAENSAASCSESNWSIERASSLAATADKSFFQRAGEIAWFHQDLYLFQLLRLCKLWARWFHCSSFMFSGRDFLPAVSFINSSTRPVLLSCVFSGTCCWACHSTVDVDWDSTVFPSTRYILVTRWLLHLDMCWRVLPPKNPDFYPFAAGKPKKNEENEWGGRLKSWEHEWGREYVNEWGKQKNSWWVPKNVRGGFF